MFLACGFQELIHSAKSSLDSFLVLEAEVVPLLDQPYFDKGAEVAHLLPFGEHDFLPIRRGYFVASFDLAVDCLLHLVSPFLV